MITRAFLMVSCILLATATSAQTPIKSATVLVGECTFATPTANGLCGRSVSGVFFEDGFMSLQFHSAERFNDKRFKEVTSFVGAGLKSTGEENTYVLQTKEIHVLDGAHQTLMHPKVSEGQCTLRFASSEDVGPAGVRSIECVYKVGGDVYRYGLTSVRQGKPEEM